MKPRPLLVLSFLPFLLAWFSFRGRRASSSPSSAVGLRGHAGRFAAQGAVRLDSISRRRRSRSGASERGLSRMRFRRGLRRLTSERARSLRVEKSRRRRQLQSRAANFALFRPTSSFVTQARNLVSSAVTQPNCGPIFDPLVAGNKCLGRTSMIVASVALLPGPSSQSPSIKDDLELELEEEAQSLLHLLPSSFLLPLSSAGGVI